jgi:hypothetical protein
VSDIATRESTGGVNAVERKKSKDEGERRGRGESDRENWVRYIGIE